MIIGPGSFYTSLMPIFLVGGVPEALAQVKGPVILVANLLTEGRGMIGFTAADAVARIEQAIHRKVDVVITNTKWPSAEVLGALRARAQGAARARDASVSRADGRGRLLDRRDRAPRSAASRLRGLECAVGAAARGVKSG